MSWLEAQNIVGVLTDELLAGKELTREESILYVQACELLQRLTEEHAG